MDVESFLALEKRRLAEERLRLQEQAREINSIRTEIYTTPSTSTTQDYNDSDIHVANGENMSLNKKTKDWINNQQNNKETENNGDTKRSGRKKKNQDDMEQWVSDTFYSYFPGFSNEYQKRQHELQKRQRENQENLIKHKMLNNAQHRKKKNLNMETSNVNSARSISSSLTSNGANSSLQGATKTDLEIINVNNPNYVPSKHSASVVRPDSARYRLLQDLRHTNLNNLINSTAEDAMEISRKQAELESARKKEYQRELMQQIEEKRRTIKLLRDKEHQQEEVLTRRLQEQLKTMKLEEQLEKERIKAVKVRFDAEQNRLSREQLLAKLENDSQLLNTKPSQNQETNKENISLRSDNKVYKYFSNSEKHDYNYRHKSSSLPTEIDLELDETEMAKIERECFHLSEKICPMCDEPLKELENFCLRCQNKLSFRIKPPTGEQQNNNAKSGFNNKPEINEQENEKISAMKDSEKERSFFLDSTQHDDCSQQMSFHVMNDTRECNKNDNKSSNISSLSPEYTSLNNLDYTNRPPYSINIEQNSVFHPDNDTFTSIPTNETSNLKSPPISDEKTFNFYDKDDYLNTSHNDDDKNIEKLRRDTDKRLSRYLKNYGDLAYQTRGTQTTPTSSGRRDTVIQGEHSLSIPLMREMPKMTRMEAVKFKHNSKELEDLQRRWDIPAVQKYTMSSVSPKVVTQIGAIKKQLQIERIFSEDTSS
ncbi:uncharacterized protein ACRADG_009618 isoform 2-T2 [Cochliomyia hominivorax]